jgi:CNT family concentrative nucleoside transporter
MIDWMQLCSIFLILGVAFLFSQHKRQVSIGMIVKGLALQYGIAYLILKTSGGLYCFEALSRGITQLYLFANEGASFVFGALADASMPWGVIFAIKVVPIVIFFGAFMSLLFHLGIIQKVVFVLAKLMQPLLGTSGPETLCAAANSLFGQTEAPLLIKHYLPAMTESEILVVMVSGMATLSGSIMAVYGSLGVSMSHLLCASMMSVPGSLVIAKILLPETKVQGGDAKSEVSLQANTSNVLDALSQGTSDGMMLSANIVAMLITFISLIAAINYVLTITIGASLDQCFGYGFQWVALLIGIPKHESIQAGVLLGEKLAINEFVAYAHLTKMALSERSTVLLTYALSGFANFSCIGIQIGGIGALAPSQRNNLLKLGFRGLLGATLVNLLNASIVGLLV